MQARIWMRLTTLVSFATIAYCGLANAQSIPRLKPLPPREARHSVAAPALRCASAASPWQPLKNQPPFTANSCNEGVPGAANPLLLTDGSVIVQDAGCQDWWRLTPDKKKRNTKKTKKQKTSLPSGYAPLYHS